MVVGASAALIAAVGCSSDDDEGAGGEQPAADAAAAAARESRGDAVDLPEVTGPVTGGRYGMPFNPMPQRLVDEYGYREDEYFIAGEATAYRPDGTWAESGEWAVEPAGSADYTTRILVRRPDDPGAFNGTVVVEWLNVTSGMDADPDFGLAHDELLRSGYAWVGVSAQVGGVEGGGGLELDIPGIDIRPLKGWDAERYSPLSHPGDAYSYDIFSQVAQVIRRPPELDPLDGLAVEQVLAVGESQSAIRMVTYVNAVHPVADIYDGFLIHSRAGSAAALDEAASDAVPPVAHIRTDLDDPVLQFQTETDLFVLGFLAARQPDTDLLRTWEVAGTAHADQATLDYGVESGREWNTTAQVDFSSQCGAVNDGPQPYVLRAAIDALAAWASGGDPPAEGEPLEVEGDAIVRDEHGNALGGVRTPAVDAPISTLTGDSDPGESIICVLFGGATPFDAQTLESLYPTNDDYVAAVTDAADAAVEAGFVLAADRDEIVAAAEDAEVPG
jgi:hypothetical protein